MANINLTVKSDFKAASTDLKKFVAVTETERKKIDKFQQSFKDEQIKRFNDRLRRSVAAVKATSGPIKAATAERRILQREIERLIKKGLDPEGRELRELTGQYQKLEKEIVSVGQAHKKNQKIMKVTQGALLAVGAGAVIMGKQAVDAFIDISKESAKAASDAEEIEGKFNVVFGNISEDATNAAKTIATDFDLAASTVNKLLGDTGDILTGLGFDQATALDLSEQVGTLALDLASFTNFAGGAEGASAALTKALLGEAESAKALGIVIRQDTEEYKALVSGIMEAQGVGLIQAKALAALTIATEQSKNAIGDYARTSESAANVQKTFDEQIKRSKENWGSYLNEGLTPVRKFFRDYLTALNDTKEAQKEFDKLLEEGKATDSIIDSLNEVQSFVETVTAGFDLSSKEIASAIVSNFGTTKAKAFELLSTYGELDQAGSQAYENILQKQLNVNKATAVSNQRSEKSAAIAKQVADDIKIQTEATERLQERREASLSTDEKKLKIVQDEINKWSEFADVEGVQILINNLVAERTILLEEQRLKQEELTQKVLDDEQEILDVKINFNDLWTEALITQSGERFAILEAEKTKAISEAKEIGANTLLIEKFYANEEIKLKKEIEDEKTKTEKEAADNRIAVKEMEFQATASLFGGLSSLLGAFSNQSREAAIASKVLASAQAGINSYLAFTQVLADPTKISPFKEIAAAGVLASGIASQVRIINTPIPTAQTGTPLEGLTVPDSGRSSRADNIGVRVSPGETVSVTPRGETGGNTITANFILNDEVLASAVNRLIESQDIRITNDNIQGGISA